MKNLNPLKRLLLLPLLMAVAVSCSDDDDNSNNGPTITEMVSGESSLSMLAEALQITGLDETLDESGSYTVFAPTNVAFTTFMNESGYDDLTEIPVAELRELLLNHLLQTAIYTSGFQTGYVKTLARGEASSNTLSMYINTSNGVVINGNVSNGGAKIITGDAGASNGVIHYVDGIIGLPTMMDHAVANPNLSSLVSALTRDDQPDFITTFSDSGTFTVFAPVNTAFTSFLSEFSYDSLDDIPGPALTSAILYHVVAGQNILSSSLTDGQEVTTEQGAAFTVQLPSGGPQILDANGRTSNVITTDIQGTNGVIHLLDKVLVH